VVLHETSGVKKAKTTDLAGVGPAPLPPIRGPRAEVDAYLIVEFDNEVWPMQCRCSTAQPHAWELLDALTVGRKRLRVSAR
jgi:hypothetical protein